MLKLVIGNKNYSSWSMRPWVLMVHFGVDFEEHRIPLFTADYKEQLSEHSPSMKVPVLWDGDLPIWDSLAICEYVSEKLLQGQALPKSMFQRAQCRSYCAEMHGGFLEIRKQMPMNIRERRRIEIGPELAEEISRIEQLWVQARDANGDVGPYLFSSFSMADAFFAPVVMRFRTYGIELDPVCMKYMDTVSGNAAVQAWVEEAKKEKEVLPDYGLGEVIKTEQ